MNLLEKNAVRHLGMFKAVAKTIVNRTLFSEDQKAPFYRFAGWSKFPKKDTENVNERQITTENMNEEQTSESQPGPSGLHIPRKENGNEGAVPTVLLKMTMTADRHLLLCTLFLHPPTSPSCHSWRCRLIPQAMCLFYKMFYLRLFH